MRRGLTEHMMATWWLRRDARVHMTAAWVSNTAPRPPTGATSAASPGHSSFLPSAARMFGDGCAVQPMRHHSQTLRGPKGNPVPVCITPPPATTRQILTSREAPLCFTPQTGGSSGLHIHRLTPRLPVGSLQLSGSACCCLYPAPLYSLHNGSQLPGHHSGTLGRFHFFTLTMWLQLRAFVVSFL